MAYSIPKLESSNYPTWASDVKYILMERGVWNIVNGDVKKPILDPKSPESVKEVESYGVKSDLALSLLYLNISTEFRRVIDDIRCPVEAWEKLKTFYQPDTRVTHMSTFSELVEARLKPSESLSLFGSRIAGINERMRNADPNFSNDYATYQLLRYLPSQFDGVVQTILRWDKDSFLYSKVLETLVAEETRLNLRDRDVTSQDTVQCSYAGTSAKRTIVCFKCHKEGHYRRNCPVFQGERASTKEDVPSSSRVSRGGSSDRWRARSKSRDRARNTSPNVRDNCGRRNRKGKQRCERKSAKSKQPQYSLYMSNCLNETIKGTEWIFDTAASHHLCNDIKYFSNFRTLTDEALSVAIKDVTCPIEGKGTVKMKHGNETFNLTNVFYSPLLKHNLLSGSCLDKDGVDFVGGKGRVKAYYDKRFLFKATLRGGVYIVPFKMLKDKKVTFAASVKADGDTSKWHKRFAHIGLPTLIHTSNNNGVRGLPIFKPNSLPECEPCKLNKFRRVSFKPVKGIRSKSPLDLLCADVWGPNKVRGRNGEKYFLSVIDDFSRRVSLYPMKDKSEVADLIISHINRTENFLGRRVKAFRSDNGTEFVNHKLDSYFVKKGIARELTNIYTPEQNGICERFNQTILNGIRTILSESGLPDSFWPDAMLYFVYTWNRVCHTKLVKTPQELYTGKVPSIRHLKPFGVVSYVGIPRQHRGKLDARANKGYMIGYAFSTRGYRVWIPESGKVLETINVTFNESAYYKDAANGAVLGPESEGGTPSTVELHRDDEVVSSDEESESLERGSEVLDVPSGSTLRVVDWNRKPVPRPDGSRTDIYYYEVGKTARLRSLREVQNYCSRNNIEFRPELFDFRGSNKLVGVISGHMDDESSVSDDDEVQGNLVKGS